MQKEPREKSRRHMCSIRPGAVSCCLLLWLSEVKRVTRNINIGQLVNVLTAV